MLCRMQVDLPDGVVVLGDAAASFNPIYGQGMTVGLKGAVLLCDLLQERLGGRKFDTADRGTLLAGFGKVRCRLALGTAVHLLHAWPSDASGDLFWVSLLMAMLLLPDAALRMHVGRKLHQAHKRLEGRIKMQMFGSM